MINRRIVINLVYFTVVALLFMVWAVRNILPVDVIDRPYRITADFASSLGMQSGNEVAYLGVGLGAIDGVERITGGVRVTMRIDRNEEIPEGSTAHLFRKSAIGEQYVDFKPPSGYDGGGPYYAAGDHIPMAKTTVPLEFSEMLRSASRLVSAISPEDVETLLDELSTGLTGRASDLRELADAGDRFTATLAERTDELDRLADNNTRLTRVIAEHRGSLGNSLTDLRDVAASLRDAKGDVAVLLDRGGDLVERVARLVNNQKGNLDCVLKALEVVVDETTSDARLDGLRTVLREGGPGFGTLEKAVDRDDEGLWVRVGLLVGPTNPPKQYVPSRTLPDVQPVPDCASPLASSGVDYTLGSASRTSTPVDGSGAALGFFLVGLAAALVLHEVNRATR
jgi:phospholipid/cholesterol/gamma-HCH transport system substrate-binding protein